MVRPLRIEYGGALYHITSRGNEKKPIFRDEKDRKIFLDLLAEVNRRYNWLCHASCLMNNPYHVRVYTQGFNRRPHRVGHLFWGRDKYILIQKENYLLKVCRYVELNPVRVKVVKRPEVWR